MRRVQVNDRVFVREMTGRLSGPYLVRAFRGYDVEIQCCRTGRRMVVLEESLCPPPSKR